MAETIQGQKAEVYHQENRPYYTKAILLEESVTKIGRKNYRTSRVKCSGPRCFTEHWTFSSLVKKVEDK